jgi:phosphoglycolate phosphatase-like HAD superfamily hydrolase
MVGDTAFDRDAARDAGMWFVGVRMDGDHRVESVGEVVRLI